MNDNEKNNHVALIAGNIGFVIATIVFALMWFSANGQVSDLLKLADQNFEAIGTKNQTILELSDLLDTHKRNKIADYKKISEVYGESVISFKDQLEEKQKTLDAVQVTVKTLEEQTALQDDLIAIQKEKMQALLRALNRVQRAYEEEYKAHMRHHPEGEPNTDSILG